jgi:hypothetical protein
VALAALAEDDVDAAAHAVEQADALLDSLNAVGAPGDAEICELHALLTASAREARDAVQEKQSVLALARRTMRGYADSLETRGSDFDTEA